MKDLVRGKEPKKVGRSNILGQAFDGLLFDEFMKRRNHGLPIDHEAMVMVLPTVAVKHGYDLQQYITKGDATFGLSWVKRWAKRHNIVDRASTNKHRLKVPPEEAALKTQTMVEMGAYGVVKYAIHKGLIIGDDETHLELCPKPKNTLAVAGDKRVKCITSNIDKMAVTVDLTLSYEDGVLEPEIIFKGLLSSQYYHHHIIILYYHLIYR